MKEKENSSQFFRNLLRPITLRLTHVGGNNDKKKKKK